MCVVSMISDHYFDKWHKDWDEYKKNSGIVISPITQAEVFNEFRELLRKAREYDKKMNQPHCELEEKKKKLKELAKEMGVDIAFIDQE